MRLNKSFAVKWLLAHGADPNIRTVKLGRTGGHNAFFTAKKMGYTSILKDLESYKVFQQLSGLIDVDDGEDAEDVSSTLVINFKYFKYSN